MAALLIWCGVMIVYASFEVLDFIYEHSYWEVVEK